MNQQNGLLGPVTLLIAAGDPLLCMTDFSYYRAFFRSQLVASRSYQCGSLYDFSISVRLPVHLCNCLTKKLDQWMLACRPPELLHWPSWHHLPCCHLLLRTCSRISFRSDLGAATDLPVSPRTRHGCQSHHGTDLCR